MSKTNRLPGGADHIYAEHLQGTPFRRKPQGDEQAELERLHLRTLSELSLNRFKWMGLPEEIDPRFMEINLFYNAFGLFFRDHRFAKYVFTRASIAGGLDMYDNPNYMQAIGVNYPTTRVSMRRVTVDEKNEPIAGIGVPVYSNYLRMPDLDIVRVYSKRLAISDRTIDINTINARQTKLVYHNERTRLSIENLDREVEQGNNSIKVRAGGQFGDDVNKHIGVLDMGINPDQIERLQISRTRFFNDACTLLGIDNSNQDKKERVVADEVNANADQALMVRYVNLQARQQACETINRIYGLDVWVEYNTMVDKLVQKLPEHALDDLAEKGFETVADDVVANAEDETKDSGDVSESPTGKATEDTMPKTRREAREASK